MIDADKKPEPDRPKPGADFTTPDGFGTEAAETIVETLPNGRNILHTARGLRRTESNRGPLDRLPYR